MASTNYAQPSSSTGRYSKSVGGDEFFLLLENGDKMLLENGDKMVIESGGRKPTGFTKPSTNPTNYIN